jgi:hypothetical protein
MSSNHTPPAVIHLDITLHRRFRDWCQAHDQPMKQVLEQAINDIIATDEAPRAKHVKKIDAALRRYVDANRSTCEAAEDPATQPPFWDGEERRKITGGGMPQRGTFSADYDGSVDRATGRFGFLGS